MLAACHLHRRACPAKVRYFFIQQGNHHVLRGKMTAIHQTKTGILGPTRLAVLDLGGDEELGAGGLGLGTEVTAAAAAHRQPLNAFGQPAGHQDIRLLQDSGQMRHKGLARHGLGQHPESTETAVLCTVTANKRDGIEQAETTCQGVIDTAGHHIKVGVAGNDMQISKQGLADKAALHRTGKNLFGGMKEKGW